MRGQSYSDWVSSCLEEPRDQVRFVIMIVAVISVISGLFIVLPCIESYKKVDLRTITLGVPPQEVFFPSFLIFFLTQLWFVFSCWPRTASPCQGRSHLIELSSKIKKQKTNEKYNQTYNWTLSAPPNRESFEMTSSLSGCSCLLQSVQRHR